MFKWTVLRELYNDVQSLIPDDKHHYHVRSDDNGEDEPRWYYVCHNALPLHKYWVQPPENANDYRHWENKFFSKEVRVTRGELLGILNRKLRLDDTRSSRHRLANLLEFEFFGELQTKGDTGNGENLKRKFVGHRLSRTQPKRRDFVRVSGVENGTCMTAEVIMFVRVSGFLTVRHSENMDGVILPDEYQHDNFKGTILFSLVRWLSPHPDSLLRDSERRPICTPPLDINHALWKFAEHARPVPEVCFRRQLHLYGSVTRRLDNWKLERNAWFDLIEPDCFETYVNCTVHESNTILETVTLPF